MKKSCVLMFAMVAAMAGAHASGATGPYSSRAALEAAARAGDVAAKWDIASAYANAGQLTIAWRWIEQENPELHPERRYFKAWLAWRIGSPAQALATLPAECSDGPCHKLKANAYIDIGLAEQAIKELELWHAGGRGANPAALPWLLSACLIAGDFSAFDRWNDAANWRDDPAYEAYRASLISLGKSRASLALQRP